MVYIDASISLLTFIVLAINLSTYLPTYIISICIPIYLPIYRSMYPWFTDWWFNSSRKILVSQRFQILESKKQIRTTNQLCIYLPTLSLFETSTAPNRSPVHNFLLQFTATKRMLCPDVLSD